MFWNNKAVSATVYSVTSPKYMCTLLPYTLPPQMKKHQHFIKRLPPAEKSRFLGNVSSPCLSPDVMLHDLANHKLKD